MGKPLFHPDTAPENSVWRNADRFRASSAEDPLTYRECMAKGMRLEPP